MKRSPEQEWSSRLELLEDESDDDNSFKEWLKRVENCLKGRKKEEPDIDNLTEEEKCMKVVRRVLDEETVLDMMKSFLHLTKVTSFLLVNIHSIFLQWNQSSPGNSASHYFYQSMIKLDFLAA